MKKVKDMFLASAVVCAVSVLLNLIYAFDCISGKNIFLAIFYIVMGILGIVCTCVFFSFRNQNQSYLIQKKNIVKTFSLIAIFCSLLGGILAFYAYYCLCELILKNNFDMPDVNKKAEIDGVEIIDDKRMAKYIDDINRLEKMKNSGIITEEKYAILKKQILSEYIKGE